MSPDLKIQDVAFFSRSPWANGTPARSMHSVSLSLWGSSASAIA
jgi:hypothetical protein